MTKKIKIYVCIMVGLCLALIIGGSYAFFAASLEDAANSELRVNTEGVNRFVFNQGEPINIVANYANFNELTSSLFDESFPSVDFYGDNGVSDYYNASFNIATNNFVYTTVDKKPELILTIYDESGIEITNLTGLTYVTVNDAVNSSTIKGFDITEVTGDIVIKNGVAITGSGYDTLVSHDWEFAVTFVNLDGDQTLNEGKNFNATFVLEDN